MPVIAGLSPSAVRAARRLATSPSRVASFCCAHGPRSPRYLATTVGAVLMSTGACGRRSLDSAAHRGPSAGISASICSVSSFGNAKVDAGVASRSKAAADIACATAPGAAGDGGGAVLRVVAASSLSVCVPRLASRGARILALSGVPPSWARSRCPCGAARCRRVAAGGFTAFTLGRQRCAAGSVVLALLRPKAVRAQAAPACRGRRRLVRLQHGLEHLAQQLVAQGGASAVCPAAAGCGRRRSAPWCSVTARSDAAPSAGH